jgi:hypothetical protein
MSQRKLPLESLDWVPLVVVVRAWGERNGSLVLGEVDTLQALRGGKVRSMCRYPGPQPERWLVPPEFWNDKEIVSTRDGVEVLYAGGSFFCWQLDLERMLGGETKSKRQPSHPAAGEQARQGAPLKYDWFAIVTEIAFREATATKKQRNKSDLAEAKSVRSWCARKLKQRPAISELREIVKLVRGRFRGPN